MLRSVVTRVGGVRFYERKEIKDALAYMRLVINPHDDVSLRRVINVPARGIGKGVIETVEKLAPAYELAAQYDTSVIAEEFIAGRELTAGFIGEQALPLVEISAAPGSFDYQHKYFSDATRYHCPCGLPAAQEQQLQALVMRAVEALGCSGWGRADLMLRDDGKPFLLEMNTSPGMTAHSLVPMAARAAGIEFDELVVRILELAHVG